MIHPAYQMLLTNGIPVEHIRSSAVMMADSIVSNINGCMDSGIISYSEWGTVRVFFDSKHVCNIQSDDKGISFEFDKRGPMRSDYRSNRVVYAVIQAIAYQP